MKTVRVMAMMAGVLGMLALFAAPVSAGQSFPNMVTIKKVVSGAVPAGTTFTVHVVCNVTVGKGVPVVTDVLFDSTGAVTSGNSVIGALASYECTATETVSGGATSVGFACAKTGVRAVCTETSTSASVEFIDETGSTGTITVTNTFPPPPVVVPTPPIVPAPEVVVAPAFTG